MPRAGSLAACGGRWTRSGSGLPSRVSSRPPTGRNTRDGLAVSGAHGPRGRQAPRGIAGWSGSCLSEQWVVYRCRLPPRCWGMPSLACSRASSLLSSGLARVKTPSHTPCDRARPAPPITLASSQRSPRRLSRRSINVHGRFSYDF